MQVKHWKWVAAAGLVMGLAGCQGKGGAALPPAPQGAVATVQVGTPQEKLEAGPVTVTGQLRARREATLSAQVTGKIKELRAEVGDKVQAGQDLVRLDAETVALAAEQARAANAAAQADLAMARQELERAEALHKAESAPQSVLDRARTGFEMATAAAARASAAARMAEVQLRDHTIRAPFAGTITARYKQVGETVAAMPPTPVITVVDTDSLEARLAVPEAVVDSLLAGQQVQGTVSPSGRPFEAKVRTVGATVDLASRTVEVLLDVVPQKGAVLRPGALVEVKLTPPSSAAAGPFVPRQAVHADDKGSFVWVVEDGVVHRRDVKVQPHSSEAVRVLDGLDSQTRIVLAGAATLREGTPVQATR